MVDIKFRCKACGKKLAIDEQAVGLTIACPDCGAKQTVPGQSEKASPPVLPPAKPPVAFQRPASPPTGGVSPPEHNAASAGPAGLEHRKELDALTARVHKLEAENRSLTADLAASREALQIAEAEARSGAEKLQQQSVADIKRLEDRLKEKEEAVRRLSEAGEKASSQIAKLEEEKRVLEQERDAGTEAFKKTLAASSQAAIRVQGLEEQNEELSKKLKAVSAPAAAAEELEKKNVKLAGELAVSAARVDELTREREALLVHKRDAETLSKNLFEIQAELKAAHEKESLLKKAVEEAEKKAAASTRGGVAPMPAQTDPWPYPDPLQRTRKWLAGAAGVAVGAMLCGVFFLVVWPALQREPIVPDRDAPPDGSPPASSESAPEVASREVLLRETFVIDDVEVNIYRARVAPVEMVLLLGYEERSDKEYLILDVKLTNRSEEHELILRNPWKGSRMTDDMGRTLHAAFTQPMQFQEVRGVTLNERVPFGEEVLSLMVFEWVEPAGESYTLMVDPGFKKPASEGILEQISFESFTMTISIDQIERTSL